MINPHVRHIRRAILGVALVSAACGVFVTAADVPSLQKLVMRDDVPSLQQSAKLRAKIILITKNGRAAAPVAARTEITELELNSYLRFDMAYQLPTGLTDPFIALAGEGRLSGRALVDLSLIGQQSKQRGMMDPLSYLTGRLPVTASGRLLTKNGIATFELQSATISGISVPKVVLQELLSAYSRSPQNPNGLNLDDSFTLPVGIREIEIGPEQAVIVQ